jgi:thioredoxin-related protein
MAKIDTLKELYNYRTTTSPGFVYEYKDGYKLEKCDGYEHSEFMIINSSGNHVETFSLGAFDDFDDFKRKLDALIEYNPSTMDDAMGWREEML